MRETKSQARSLTNPLRVASRLLALVVALQVGGIAHGLSSIAAGSDACAEPCEDDEGGEQCPPFCFDCTCAHAARPAVPLLGGVVVQAPRSSERTLPPTDPNTPPDEPELRGVFHPPRA